MNRFSKSLAAVLLCSLTFHAYAKEERVTYKAAKSSSSYYQMAVQVGENIAQATNKEVMLTIEESQGSVQNVKEAPKRTGNYIFTTPPGLIALAQSGKAMFEKDKPESYDNIRSLFPIPYLTMHVVVRADSNIKTFADLNGKTLLIGKGSFGAKEAARYIKLFGLEDKTKLIDAELSGAVTALKNGQIDGFATSGSFPAPNVIEAAASMPIRILSMSDAQIALTEQDKIIIPKGTYAGVDEDIATTTLPVGLYTTAKMSDALAYKITKAFWESKAKLEKQNVWWKAVSPENLTMFNTKLHPGALKYYNEMHIVVPDKLK
jgi:hypothetical protein